MTDNLFTAWTNQLLAYQRQYQDAWQAFGAHASTSGGNRGEAADGNAVANPWVAALELWWKTVQPTAAAPVQDFYGRLVDQGKIYLQMTDSLNKAVEQATAASVSAAQWQDALNVALADLKEAFSGDRYDVHGAARQTMAFWELPLNNWQRAASSLSVLPGDVLQGVNAMDMERVRDELHGRVDQLLSTPAVGHMREHQEQYQTLAKLTLDYQRALHDYMASYGQLSVKSVEALQQQIRQRSESGEQVRSLRELYDLWVDSCEQAYADHVRTDEYVALYGQLVNSLMALKRHGGMMVDEALGAMNMPNRGENDTLHGRLHEMRWEEKALRAEIETMKDQLQALAAKQRAGNRPKQAAAGRKKSASAKSSADKKSRAKKKISRPTSDRS